MMDIAGMPGLVLFLALFIPALAPAEQHSQTVTAADHRINISYDPKCRWPLATALLQLTGAGEP